MDCICACAGIFEQTAGIERIADALARCTSYAVVWSTDSGDQHPGLSRRVP